MLFRKKKVSIVQIATCCTDNLWYVVGLGTDGKSYLWDKWACVWILNHQEPNDEQKEMLRKANPDVKI